MPAPQKTPLPTEPVDVAIVGGGLVGASLACALNRTGRRVALIEAIAETRAPERPSFDERNLALAEASLNALTALGVLAHLPRPPAAIRHIHVSRAGDFGAVRLNAGDYGRERFGGVVVARDLGRALETRLAELPALLRLCPARLTGLDDQGRTRRLHLDSEGQRIELSARLVVAADGSRGFARRALGIDAQEHDYRQTLFVASVAADAPPDGRAWERFTDTGPIALLPRPDGRFGSVLSVARDQADAVAALSDTDYLALLQQRFGTRAGRLSRLGARTGYPIVRVLADQLAAPRGLVMGNAAQTLHPIGAQGFNLGLRDALSYAELLDEAGPETDPGDPELLTAYVEARREDRAHTLAFSDGLARLTGNPGTPARALRGLGMLALEHLPGLKAPLVAGAMGYRGRVPRLAWSET